MKKEIRYGFNEEDTAEDFINKVKAHLGVQSNFCTVKIDQFTTIEDADDEYTDGTYALVEVTTGLNIELPGNVFLNVGIECNFYPTSEETTFYAYVDISDNPLNDDTTLELFTTDDGKAHDSEEEIYFDKWLTYQEMIDEAHKVVANYFNEFMSKINNDFTNMTFNVSPRPTDTLLFIEEE